MDVKTFLRFLRINLRAKKENVRFSALCMFFGTIPEYFWQLSHPSPQIPSPTETKISPPKQEGKSPIQSLDRAHKPLRVDKDVTLFFRSFLRSYFPPQLLATSFCLFYCLVIFLLCNQPELQLIVLASYFLDFDIFL